MITVKQKKLTKFNTSRMDLTDLEGAILIDSTTCPVISTQLGDRIGIATCGKSFQSANYD